MTRMNQIIFLFECDQSRNVSECLNGEPPYRENLYDYYMLDDDRVTNHHVMHIHAFSQYNRSNPKVRKAKERIVKKIAEKHPDKTIILLRVSNDLAVSLDKRIKDALAAYKETGNALRVVR